MRSISRPSLRLPYKWRVMIVLALGMLMSMMDSTIVNIAIPQMQHAFHADFHAVQWVVTIYMLTQATVIPLAPFLTATLGGKRAYVWTLSAFLLGSLLCGFAWNLPSLIFFRFVQGIGGGVLLPMVMILQYQAFPREERGRATSVMGIAMMVAPALGPVVGGYLVNAFGWQWTFFINVPLGIIGVLAAQWILKPTQGERGLPFDASGFITEVIGSALLLYTLPVILSGAGTLIDILLLVVSLLFLALFVTIELRKAHNGRGPLLDLRRFSDAAFRFSTLAQILVFFAWFGFIFLIPIYLQTLHNETAWQAGLVQAAIPIATLIVLPIGGRMADRIGARLAVIPGLLLLAAVMALMITLRLDTPVWLIVIFLFLLGCANGLTNQIQVSALQRIRREEDQQLMHATTLISVLRAAAAPLGVATIASVIQVRSQQYVLTLSMQGLKGQLLQLQSDLLAMHDGFLITALLMLLAFVSMYCVPSRKKIAALNAQQELRANENKELVPTK